MRRFQIGLPNRECRPNQPRFFGVATRPTCTRIEVRLDVSPANAMPSNRRNPTLDEQSFQGLLSAAYTIQEHNERLNQPILVPPAPPSRTEPESSICHHCGATIANETAQCSNCGAEDYRPGERLQRNWASMWLRSQEQGLWPERSSEIREAAPTGPPPLDRGRLRPQAELDFSASAVMAPPDTKSNGQGTITQKKPVKPLNGARNGKSIPGKSKFNNLARGKSTVDGSIFDEIALQETALDETTVAEAAPAGSVLGESTHDYSDALNPSRPSVLDNAAASSNWIHGATKELTSSDLTYEELTRQDQTQANFVSGELHAQQQFELSTSEDSLASAQGLDAVIEPSSWLERLRNARVKLLFHRADLYLGMAILIAVLAVFWPAVSSPQPAALGLWDRALIAIGIAEAPVPAVHLQGDPGLEVWVDPHTALYYCPGEEPYGKTADGRLTSQREAQMESFEPAGRLACE
jgi:hypothetical protein